MELEHPSRTAMEAVPYNRTASYNALHGFTPPRIRNCSPRQRRAG